MRREEINQLIDNQMVEVSRTSYKLIINEKVDGKWIRYQYSTGWFSLNLWNMVLEVNERFVPVLVEYIVNVHEKELNKKYYSLHRWK